MRFLVGLCESAYFPVIIYLISSRYKRSERGKRVTIFYSTATLAGMFSGYLQAAAYSNLDGRSGLEGWQWLYIVCGSLVCPLTSWVTSFVRVLMAMRMMSLSNVDGLYSNLQTVPDFPENTHAFYLKKEEIALARQRLLDEGYKPLGASA